MVEKEMETLFTYQNVEFTVLSVLPQLKTSVTPEADKELHCPIRSLVTTRRNKRSLDPLSHGTYAKASTKIKPKENSSFP